MRPQHLLSLLLLLLAPAIRAAILAIDYGAEFTKLSLIKPGVPFDVVLDKDSKRKISSVVGWKRDERVFGAEAKMSATRFPDTHYPYVKPLLGKTTLPPLSIWPNAPSSDGESIVFPHPSAPSYISPALPSPEAAWTPTALLAQQLSYYRHLAESLGTKKESINQVVVTVPAWWNHAQRRAYRDALELQGMSCLAMIGEGTGVALNYAMTRTFPDYNPATGAGEKEYHVIYDSGALSTTATVLAFYQTSEYLTPKSKTPINTTHIETLGTGWENVGGVLLDVAIQDILVEDFIKKSGKTGIEADKKALAKVAKEATRVKHILSANYEANTAIESLFDDTDYRSQISRASLEEALASTESLFSKPLTSALSAAGLSLSDINSFVLFGGNTRVPLVQTSLKSVLGNLEDRIAQNVNTDEAAVLGAAYYGAALSKQFKMKNIEVKESSVGDIIINGGDVLFPEGTVLGEKKVLTLPAEGDINLEFSQSIAHPESSHGTSGPQPILSVQVYDIEKALKDFTAPSPVVNLTIRFDPKGHLSAANAVLVSNVTESKDGGVAGALKGLFGGKEDDKQQVEEVASEGEKEEKKDGKKAPTKVALKFREKHLGVKPLSGEEKRTTNARLNSIAAFESAKASREEALNSLESYIYALQNHLSDYEPTALKDFSTPAEQTAIKDLVAKTFEWLNDVGDQATERELRTKYTALEILERPPVFRYNEYTARDGAVADFQKAMRLAASFFIEAKGNWTEAIEAARNATPEDPATPPKYTKEELGALDDMLREYTKWIDELMPEQLKLDEDKTKDPVIKVRELEEKGKNLQATVMRLTNKKNPRKPKPTTSSSSASSSVTLDTQTDHGPSPTLSEKEAESTTESKPTDKEPLVHDDL
ncbi:hypothetical protein I350_01420 [Cryptococcus amylolentus CBS 6273]|uniref:Hypoxia up-regulated protein 1 n=1 Tax=Cryptococcus amylolentus CBS 6273 TaxID=1296118 RepID=A0A1E3KEV6_9TREE|nr:hypothetical protein I350_01420 [Cryptococcus amylolentus CBS 6273]